MFDTLLLGIQDARDHTAGDAAGARGMKASGAGQSQDACAAVRHVWPMAGLLGGIEDCDFSGAELDGCRFVGCDVSTLKFPAWPCFTILDPVQRSRELAALQWPGQVGIVARTFSKSPPSTAAITLSATKLAREFGTTEEDIRAVLDRLDGVKL